MKITTFDPMILSKDAESVISLFEDLGFEKKHVKKELGDGTVTDVRMRNADGFHVDIVQLDAVPQDVMQIRMNVDNFDEAFELLAAHGFKNAQGDKISESATSKGTSMVSPSGFTMPAVVVVAVGTSTCSSAVSSRLTLLSPYETYVPVPSSEFGSFSSTTASSPSRSCDGSKSV